MAVDSNSDNDGDNDDRRDNNVDSSIGEDSTNNIDSAEYEVERIVGMKSIIRRGRSCQLFLIKWKGYEEPTWEPRQNLMCPEILQKFLTQHL